MSAPKMQFDQENQEVLPPHGGPVGQDLEVRVFGSLVTAQRVAVARNEMTVYQKLRQAAAINGDNYYYEWETKNRDGSRGLVTGITIKGAMLVARLFGNLAIDVRAVPYSETHEMFYARFADLETGFSTVRAFKQRKNQNIGMKDKERGEDIIFQIGQSKAIRNVINNALQDFCGDLVEKSRSALIERMEADGKYADKVVATLQKLMEKHGVTNKMAETYIGRPLSEWVNRHIAKAYVALKSIDNGDATVADVFGTEVATIKDPEQKQPDKETGGKEADGNSQGAAAGGGEARKRTTPKRDGSKKPDAAGATQAEATQGQPAEADKPTETKQEDKPQETQSQGTTAAPAQEPKAPDQPSNRQASPEQQDMLAGGATAAPQQEQQRKDPPQVSDDDWGMDE